jgi:hypothetical protein
VPSSVHAGRCLCGAVKYECGEPVSRAALCHCESCRRAAGAHVVAWATVRKADYRITQGTPRSYASTAPVIRTFCECCGTQLTYWHQDAAEFIDVTLGSLDDPGAIVPSDHLWMEDSAAWDRPKDGLPQWCTSRAAKVPFDSSRS